MEKVTIHNRFTGEIIHEGDAENVKELLISLVKDGADLRGADLRGANLRGADLYGADLYGADLDGADLDGANLDGEKLAVAPLTICGLRYWILISDNFMRIGCQRHPHADWAAFSEDQIQAMDGTTASVFWEQWKVPLMAACAAHKENATKHAN